MMIWLRSLFALAFLTLMFRFRGYLLDTESQLLYGVLPLLLSSFFFFEKPKRAFSWADGLLLCFMGVLALSSVFAQHPFGFFELTTYGAGALVYFFVRFVELPKWKWREALVGAGALFSVFALVHFLLSPTDRLSGFFHGYESYTFYPNAAALFLLPILVFNLELFFKKQRFWGGVLFLNTAAFVLTFSRGAYLVAMTGAVLALIFFLKQIFKKTVRRKTLSALLVGLLATAFALGLNLLKSDAIVVSERLLLKDDAGFASVSERVDFWRGAVEMTLDHPWLGVGPGGFGAYYPEYQTEWLALSDHPHNVILKLSSEVGIPGALLFLGFLMGIFFVGVDFKAHPEQKVLWLAAAVFLGHNLLDYNLNFNVLSALFFALLAVLQNAKPRWAAHQGTRLALFGLGVLSLALTGLSLWEGVRLVEARNMQQLYEANPSSGIVREYVQNPPFIPFEMSHFDMEANLAYSLGEDAVLQSFLDRFPNYSTYHRWLYFETLLNPLDAGALLSSNGKNELEYYYLFYSEQQKSSSNVDAVEQLITLYTHLLSQNEHMTVLSQNPLFARKLCELYPDELKNTCDVFEAVWALEVFKFNQRYGTQLTLTP